MITKKDQHREFVQELLEKIKSHLPEGSSLELAILKGHILLEFYMNKVIELLADSDFDISKSNFSFKHKIDILRILGLTPDLLETYKILKEFNSIRNQLAHRLEFDRNKIDELLRFALKSTPYEHFIFDTDEQRAKAFKVFIPYLTGHLSATFSMKEELKLNWSELKKQDEDV